MARIFRFKWVVVFSVFWMTASHAQQSITVWPGDTDNNGVVNNLDFLQIGLAYNFFGSPRVDSTLAWAPSPAVPWAANPAGINAAYADANGDGVVNYFYDVFPVYVHYGQTRPNAQPPIFQTGLVGVDPQVRLEADSASTAAQAGQSLRIPVALGTAALPVQDIYGFAFSVFTDPVFFNTQQITGNFNEVSWLNNDNDRFSAIRRVSDSQIDVAFVRTDRNSRSGFGRVGYLDFIIIDDIVGLQRNTSIRVGDIRAIDRFGNEMVFAGDSIPIVIQPDLSTSPPVRVQPSPYISLYPNPGNGLYYLECLVKMEQLRVFDAMGGLIKTETPQSDKVILQLQYLPSGIYFVEVQTTQGIARLRLVQY